jgi:hypothetical protein
MTRCHLTPRLARSAFVVAASTLVALAAACASPTSPTADNAAAPAARTAISPTVHNACGVMAGSDQC